MEERGLKNGFYRIKATIVIKVKTQTSLVSNFGKVASSLSTLAS